MVKINGILLLFTLGAIVSPSKQANDFGAGGLGKILHGRTTGQGVVGGLLTGITRAVNVAVCRTLGPNFLPVMSTNINNHCPEGYFTPDNFKSFEKLCDCYNSDPKLQRCFMSSVITVGLIIPGVSDITARIAQCCNSNKPYDEFEFIGQIGLAALDNPRNSDALINELIYGTTDGVSDLLCSLVGPSFFEVLVTDDSCPIVTLSPSTFKSMESFCYKFRNEWSPDVQNCMTDAAIRYLVKLEGIGNIRGDLGDCCAHCPGIKPDDPPPHCKSDPPKVPSVTVPKCGC